MVSGVPTGSSLASRRSARSRMRMQPCDGRPGISFGALVPWMPMYPPAGHSVSTAERALVPNAIGP